MNSHLSRRRFLEAAVATTAWSRGGASQSRPGTAPPVRLGSFSPRGLRRILYVSDPSSIARRHLPDPVSEQDLRKWVDTLAAARVDLFIQEAYTQGWTTYWRSPRFDYDARPQHRRFLPLLDRGKQPLGILLDQCRRRRMAFLAGIRVNDNHGHVSIRQGVGAGAAFPGEQSPVADSGKAARSLLCLEHALRFHLRAGAGLSLFGDLRAGRSF